jgi:hypothetical protein
MLPSIFESCFPARNPAGLAREGRKRRELLQERRFATF